MLYWVPLMQLSDVYSTCLYIKLSLGAAFRYTIIEYNTELIIHRHITPPPPRTQYGYPPPPPAHNMTYALVQLYAPYPLTLDKNNFGWCPSGSCRTFIVLFRYEGNIATTMGGAIPNPYLHEEHMPIFFNLTINPTRFKRKEYLNQEVAVIKNNS